MKFCKSKKRITAYVLLALCAATTAYAATEHWNDASLTPKAVVATQAGDQNWEQWKSSGETIKTDYEQVCIDTYDAETGTPIDKTYRIVKN
ncbi:hypothetical protein [uncultured Selenomonas sp.]|uniref:hypothetical protein n=1 Tax=uncultured Selenomonas sp. TaxID=159275 RepID=UPI0025840921|nr:hypothetical protein [uncultured Selenomonas sp.]